MGKDRKNSNVSSNNTTSSSSSSTSSILSSLFSPFLDNIIISSSNKSSKTTTTGTTTNLCPTWQVSLSQDTPTLGIEFVETSESGFSVLVGSIDSNSIASIVGIEPNSILYCINEKAIRHWSFDKVQHRLTSNTTTTTKLGIMSRKDFEAYKDLNRMTMTVFPAPKGSALPGLSTFVDDRHNEDNNAVNGLQEGEDEEEEQQQQHPLSHVPPTHFWMTDRSVKGCHTCDRLFTLLWRRHHCRSCGHIFCSNCVSRLDTDASLKNLDTMSLSRLSKQLVCSTCHSQLQSGLEFKYCFSRTLDRRRIQQQEQLGGSARCNDTLVMLPSHAVGQSSSNRTMLLVDAKSSFIDLANRTAADQMVGSNFAGGGSSSTGNILPPSEPKANDLFSMFPKVQIVTSHPVGRVSATTAAAVVPSTTTTTTIVSDNALNSKVMRKSVSDPALYCITSAHREPLERAALCEDDNHSTDRREYNNQYFSSRRYHHRFKATFNNDASRKTNNDSNATRMSSSENTDNSFHYPFGLAHDAISVSEDDSLVGEMNDIKTRMNRDGNDRIDELLSREFENQIISSSCSSLDVLKWKDLLSLFAKRAAHSIEMSNKSDMDVISYVDIMLFPDSQMEASTYIDGVLYRKSLSHKSMKQSIRNPRILLIASSLQYENTSNSAEVTTSNTMSTLEAVAFQELEYLHIVVGKILAIQPDVVIFGGHLHRVAEDLLYKHGVVVVKNASLLKLNQIARSTGAVLLASANHVDKVSPKRVLGKCSYFKVEMMEDPNEFSLRKRKRRQYLLFEGADAKTGCTIVLHGVESMEVLTTLKGILQRVIRAAYNLRLQRASLSELFLYPPPPPVSIENESSVSNDWFNTSSSLYLSLKPNSLSLRAAHRDQLGACKSCKSGGKSSTSMSLHNRSIASEGSVMDQHLSNVTRRKRHSDAVVPLSFKERASVTSTNDQRSCSCKEEASKCREKLLLSACWSTSSSSSNASTSNKVTSNDAEMMCLEFYNSTRDCSVGGFLESYCFGRSSDNDIFTQAFVKNKLTFTHDVGRVVFEVKSVVENGREYSGSGGGYSLARKLSQDDAIYIWTGVRTAVTNENLSHQYVKMGVESFNYSFGKYLEDCLYGPDLYKSGGKLRISRNDLCRYYSRNGYIVRVTVDRVSPVLHVALHPVLWRNTMSSTSTNSNTTPPNFDDSVTGGLKSLATEVYDCTMTKIRNSMEDFVTTSNSKKVLKIIQNEVRHWMDLFSVRLIKTTSNTGGSSSTGGNVLVANKLIREMYMQATDWSLRISETMQSTVKLQSSSRIASPKGALPRAWFDGLEEDVTQSPVNLTMPAMSPTESVSDMSQLATLARQIASGKVGNITNPTFTQSSPALLDMFDSPTLSPNNITTSSSGSAKLRHSTSASNNRKRLESVDIGAEPATQKLGYYAIPQRLLSFHPSLPIGVNDTVILVNECEPTSVISYSLSSKFYAKSIKEAISLSKNVQHSRDRKSLLVLLSFSHRSDVNHVFNDEMSHFSPLTKFKCKSFFGMQFHALRKLYYGGDGGFIESMSHCSAWAAAGGKSGAGFMKTRDSRFIAKVIPASELAMFLSVAPEYFRYMAKTFDENLSSMLSKILGIYEITIDSTNNNDSSNTVSNHLPGNTTTTSNNNLATNITASTAAFKSAGAAILGENMMMHDITGGGMTSASTSASATATSTTTNTGSNAETTTMCILVMENLVYGRDIDCLFDLKGKLDGRFKKQESTDDAVVLWDQNFLSMTSGIPLGIQETSMSMLLSAIQNDTAFLASIEVTDYSMLVGYDVANQELVACIIDYIHKYDLLKMVEYAGKRLIQEEGEITILNPKQYRKRFCKAMQKYFTTVPSRYTAVMSVPSSNASSTMIVPPSTTVTTTGTSIPEMNYPTYSKKVLTRRMYNTIKE